MTGDMAPNPSVANTPDVLFFKPCFAGKRHAIPRILVDGKGLGRIKCSHAVAFASPIGRTPLCVPISAIGGGRAQKQMIDIDAGGCVAVVTDHSVVRHVDATEHQGQPRRAGVAVVDPEPPVSVFVAMAPKQNATALVASMSVHEADREIDAREVFSGHSKSIAQVGIVTTIARLKSHFRKLATLRAVA